jgi:peptide/nickel transport system substrate-binding protein
MRTSSIALHHVGGALFGPGNLVTRCRENMYLICPGLAKSWIANPGFTEWTFSIRPGVTWHDGKPFTAQDAKFWFDLAAFGAQNDKGVRPPAYFKGELGDIKKVEVLSGERVKVTFGKRYVPFVEALANPRLKIAHPRHLMEPRITDGHMDVSPVTADFTGAGPFKMESYKSGSLVSVRRYERYWERDSGGRALPHLDGIDYLIMTEPTVMDAAFRTGRLHGGARGEGHYLSVIRKAQYVQDIGEKTFFAQMEGGMYRLAFNVLKPGPWQDARVRRAMALWIDEEAAIPVVLGGFGWTSPSFGPENPYKKKNFLNWPRFDQGPLAERRTEAKRLMAEAGYAHGFAMGHLCRALSTTRCEFLKDQLAGLGIELQLTIVDEGTWNRERITARHDSQEGAATPSPVPEGTESVYGRYSENPDAYAKHEDRAIDAHYHRLRESLSLEQRIRVWREVEQYLYLEKTYIVPIAVAIQVVPYRTAVKGLAIPTEDGHTNTDFATVWLDKSLI